MNTQNTLNTIVDDLFTLFDRIERTVESEVHAMERLKRACVKRNLQWSIGRIDKELKVLREIQEDPSILYDRDCSSGFYFAFKLNTNCQFHESKHLSWAENKVNEYAFHKHFGLPVSQDLAEAKACAECALAETRAEEDFECLLIY